MVEKIKITFLVFVIPMFISSCQKEHHTLLIETESFLEKGGWKVDPQFVEQMGSPYLLAHGLGKPVENACTTIELAAPGDYFIWARTKNWVPGEWKAPGRFKIIVNGRETDNILGTGNENKWKWQYAGQVKLIKRDAVIEIKDLTGFEGRCDAIFFNSVNKPPPYEQRILKQWRKEQLNEAQEPEGEEFYDLVVVGGGIAGCAASIAAAEQGMNVVLVHDRPVLGGNASSEIRVHTEGITWRSERILNMLNTEHYPNGSPLAKREDEKRLNNILKYDNITLYLDWRAYTTNTISDSITSVDARHTSTGERKRFTAPLFIDCTGDGWIGYWAGAEYMYGREDSLRYHENWAKYGELWSPAKPDNRVMGASVLWRTKQTKKPSEFPALPWAVDVAGDYAATHGTWHWEYSKNDLHQIDDAEKIRDHMLRAVYGSFYNAKQKPENHSLELEWVSYLIGKRESRRLTGPYIYTFNDMRKMKKFPDAIVKEKRNVDVHYQRVLVDSTQPDFLSEALYFDVPYYYIPYRCLYSINIENLLMAGRCFSCSHIGLGGPRVMNTTGQMGVAAGYAASLCKKYKTTPHGVYKNHINELRNTLFTNTF